MSQNKDRETVPISGVNGNALFEKAVAAVGLDETAMRWLFVSVLNTIGTTPAHLTPEELGNLLPEVDRRLRKLVQEEWPNGGSPLLPDRMGEWSRA